MKKSQKSFGKVSLKLVEPQSAPVTIQSVKEMELIKIQLRGINDADISFGRLAEDLPHYGMMENDIIITAENLPIKPGDLVMEELKNHPVANGMITRFEASALQLAFSDGNKSKSPKIKKRVMSKITHIIRAV